MHYSLPKSQRSSRSIFSKYERTHNSSEATRLKTMGTTTVFTFFILASLLLGLTQCLPGPMFRSEAEASDIKVIAEGGTNPEIKVLGERTKPEIKVIRTPEDSQLPQPPKPTEKELLSLKGEENDMLLRKVPFKPVHKDLQDVSETTAEGLTQVKPPKIDATPRLDYFEVYRPPQIEPPAHGRYPIEYKDGKTKAADFDPTQAQGQYVFNYLIKTQIDNQIRGVDENDKAILRSLLSRTSNLYGFGEKDNAPKLVESAISKVASFLRISPTPSSIMKEAIEQFKRVDFKISLRRELWTLITFHAFHSPEAEVDLIVLYRTEEFRTIMMDFISELTKFETKEKGLAWPIHEEILKIEHKEIQYLAPSYHNFMRFHSYLLKRTHNELMERLDRDVLISQLEKHQIHPDATEVLKSLHSNWREVDIVEEQVKKLAMETRAKVDHLDPKEDAVELQGAMNILLHLRAFGSEELKTMIEDSFKSTMA